MGVIEGNVYRSRRSIDLLREFSSLYSKDPINSPVILIGVPVQLDNKLPPLEGDLLPPLFQDFLFFSNVFFLS
jgi:hypothetical protein